MTRQHSSPERKANHAEGQRKIVHTCRCGRLLRGNAAWYSHRSVGRPGCTPFSAGEGGW